MNREEKGSSTFFSGFLFGVIIGGLLVFLFATEKGKKILKVLKEEGLQGVDDLKEYFDEDEVENGPEEIGIKSESSSNGSLKHQPGSSQESIIEKKSASGRLFKGLKKKIK